jgi:hypothetical protein
MPGLLCLTDERKRVQHDVRPRLLLALLLLLLHRLYYLPDQVPGLALHLDGIGLVRVVELEHVLNAPDLAQGTCQHLCRTLLLASLLLLILLLLPLLLIALRHIGLLATRRLHYPEVLHYLPTSGTCFYTLFASKSDTETTCGVRAHVYLQRGRGTTDE